MFLIADKKQNCLVIMHRKCVLLFTNIINSYQCNRFPRNVP